MEKGSMMLLGAGDVERLMDARGLVEAVREVLVSDAVAPPRVSLEHGGAWLAAMPAAGLRLHVVKAVGIYPGNVALGLPLIRGVLVALDEGTGEALLAADAGAVTAWRTPAASALALEVLGYRGGGVLGVVGAGVQGRMHARILSSLYRPERILVYSITGRRAEKLASEVGGEVAPLERLLKESDVVVAATLSREPVVRGRLLKSGAYVVSVGAPKPVHEVDRDALARAGCLLVDTLDGYRREAGEAEDEPEGLEVVELRDVVRGVAECRPREVAVYKSVGTGLFDLAAAVYLARRLGLKA
ncbi:ornithine cyclodeaminase family protein [Stetteria hydrogenophila]